MTKEQALEIIEQALNAASLRGVYNLNDVKVILEAMQILKEK